MSDYRVADGHDIALVSLTVLSPQPRGGFVQPTRRTYGADDSVNDEALFVELRWDLLEGASAYQSLLTTFGINAAETNEVTVYVPDETFTYTRYNGTAVRPRMGEDVTWDRYFPRDIRIVVHSLAVSS